MRTDLTALKTLKSLKNKTAESNSAATSFSYTSHEVSYLLSQLHEEYVSMLFH